jgi:hypothetical protein
MRIIYQLIQSMPIKKYVIKESIDKILFNWHTLY